MAIDQKTKQKMISAYQDGTAIHDIAEQFNLTKKRVLSILVNEIGYAVIREGNREARAKEALALKEGIERALTRGFHNPEIIKVEDMAKTIGMRADIFPRMCVKFQLEDELRKVKEVFKQRRKS